MTSAQPSVGEAEARVREGLRRAKHPGEPLMHGEESKPGCPVCEAEVALRVLAEHAERAEGATMKMEEVNRLTRRALAAEALVVEFQEALRDLEPLLDALAAMGWLKGEAALGIVRAALVAGTVFPTSNQQDPPPQAEELEELLRAADAAASVAHDFIYDRNGVTREQASEAIWLIHNALRPLFEDDPEPGPVADIAAVLDRAQREHRATWKDVRRDR